MYKKIFIFGIFSLFVNINFLASEDDDPEIPVNDNPDIPKYKLIFLGDQYVGKSCIINRFKNDTFTNEDYEATIGLDFQTKEKVQIDNQDIHLLLYDTSGQEKFKSLIPMYTRDADIILLVYDITSRNSFNNLSIWLGDLTNAKEDAIFAVVGNKTDLEDTREVNAEEGKKFAEEKNFIFAEVSAKTGDGIKKLFDVILKKMLKKKLELLQPLPQPQPQVINQQGFGGGIEPEIGKKDCCCC